MIKGVHHTALTTANLERLIDFYERELGFELVWKTKVAGGPERSPHIAFVRAGNAFLELFEFDETPSTPVQRVAAEPGLLHLCLNVLDIDGEYERLVSAGVRFEGPPKNEGSYLRFCFASDPDGNAIELLEILDDNVPFHLSRAGDQIVGGREDGETGDVKRAGDNLRAILS